MDKEKVLKLAKLARIELSAEEAQGLSGDLGSILGYVSEIKGANVSDADVPQTDFLTRNVLREDADPHESGIYTEDILSQVPNRIGDHIGVKKIL